MWTCCFFQWWCAIDCNDVTTIIICKHNIRWQNSSRMKNVSFLLFIMLSVCNHCNNCVIIAVSVYVCRTFVKTNLIVFHRSDDGDGQPEGLHRVSVSPQSFDPGASRRNVLLPQHLAVLVHLRRRRRRCGGIGDNVIDRRQPRRRADVFEDVLQLEVFPVHLQSVDGFVENGPRPPRSSTARLGRDCRVGAKNRRFEFSRRRIRVLAPFCRLVAAAGVVVAVVVVRVAWIVVVRVWIELKCEAASYRTT